VTFNVELSVLGYKFRCISLRGVVLAIALIASPPTLAQGTVVTEEQNGSMVEIAKDRQVEIRLPVQAGTGYSWELLHPPTAPLRLISSESSSATGGSLPGGPATQLFVFAPIAPGSGELEFGYRRPWETTAAPARTFRLRVVVH
jgi:predicted secreted protein